MSQIITDFPNFVKLDIDHRFAFSEFNQQFPSSDFNFAGLFTWDVTEAVKICILNGNLVIQSADYITHQPFYSFLGNNSPDATAQILLKYAIETGAEKCLRLIPESMAHHFKNSLELTLNEDRDNDDYILSVEYLVEFKASVYRGKRNLLNRFERNYGEKSTASLLDLNDQSSVLAINAVIKDWQDSRNKTNEDTQDEIIAIDKAVKFNNELNMKAFGVFADDKLIAFTIFEVLPHKTAVIHFDKANVTYEGVFERLKHTFAVYLDSIGVEYINYEQDLGVEGLRRAKESYHPVKYIKKYTLDTTKN